MPDYPQEGTLRGGHIKGAKSVPWARAANPDGSFKDANSLRAIYEQEKGLKKGDDIVAYCRIGERSSHTWFVLTYLLGYDRVRNYDGSWTEWGNAVRAPIEKGEARKGATRSRPPPRPRRSRRRACTWSGPASKGSTPAAPAVRRFASTAMPS